MYQRLREGFRVLTPTQQGGTRRSPRCAPGSKDLESEAWRWLFENRKLGVGDLVRQGRWKDALMFLSFVMSSYRSLKRDSTFPMHEYIPKSSVSTPRGKQAIMEAMIAIQLNLYDRLHLEEFINLPIEECANPLSMAVRIMTAATGKVHSSRERKVMPMSSQDAWNLLQSLLNRINGTRNSIRKIRDWAYRLPSCDKRTLLLCAADFKGRIRRSMVPVIITIFYTAVKGALRQSEEMAWSSLQAILPRMSAALRHQMCAYIHGYRKLGYFHVSNLGPSGCCLNDNYLKVCSDLLNELPHFMWRDLYQSLTEKYKISMERRTHFLSKPMSSHISAPRNVYISDNRESDDFSLSTGNGIAYAR